MQDVDVFKNNKALDNILHRISFACVSHLMSKDMDKEYYKTPENLSRESQKLAVELKVLTSRVLSLAFNENKLEACHAEERTSNR